LTEAQPGNAVPPATPADPENAATSQTAVEHHARPIAVYGAVLANLGITIAKFVAATLTGSSAMLSEGIHSAVDTANQGLLLIGIRGSRKPADDDHPFGHGKDLYFWSLVVAVVLFGLGGGLAIYEGIIHILAPEHIEDFFISYSVLGIAFVLESASWTIAIRELRNERRGRSLVRTLRYSKDSSLVTVVFEDTAALIGLIAAFLGILAADLTKDPRFDGVGSLVIGGVLVIVAVVLAYESRGLLIGERAEPELVEEIRSVALADPGVAAVKDVRTMHMGPRNVLVVLRASFRGDSAADVEATIVRLKARLQQVEGGMLDLTIEPVAAEAGATTLP
jgi:cation diffusion facilitator family transporter